MGGSLCCSSERKKDFKSRQARFAETIERQVRAVELKYEAQLLEILDGFVDEGLKHLEISCGNKAEAEEARWRIEEGFHDKLPALIYELTKTSLEGSVDKEALQIRLRRPGERGGLLRLRVTLDLQVPADSQWHYYEFTVPPYCKGDGKLSLSCKAVAVVELNYVDYIWVQETGPSIPIEDIQLEVGGPWLSAACSWIANEQLSQALKGFLNEHISSYVAGVLLDPSSQAVLGDLKDELLAHIGAFPPEPLRPELPQLKPSLPLLEAPCDCSPG